MHVESPSSPQVQICDNVPLNYDADRSLPIVVARGVMASQGVSISLKTVFSETGILLSSLTASS